ncbi:ABC transporter permease subunit [Halobacillus salinus]|uniref:ABC transporter permease subunit n=1 Tax=Halobacillus salinus TaxID=192814 RepID=UPI0009A80639|nr:ABC transporter permease subunit [Halobacillus salinus]
MRSFIRFLNISLVIILLGSLISLFQGGLYLNLTTFWDNFIHLLSIVFRPWELTYQTTSFVNDAEYPVFPTIFEYYGYSFLILLCGFLLALFLAIILTVFTFYLPPRRRNWLIQGSTILESIPDLFIIVVAQLFFIFIYKQTGILVFQVAGAFERPFLLPLVTYSILPTIFLYRTLIIIFDEEMNKPYVELAMGKGLGRLALLVKHVFRNGIASLMNHSRMIMAFMLSNLIMLEILFNAYGIMWFIINHPTYEIATICVLMIFIPLYLLEELIRKWRSKSTGGALE